MREEKKRDSSSDFVAAQMGNVFAFDVQQGTSEAIRGMELFRGVAESKANVGFEQVKGNLFEYIEAVKFNTNAANAGDITRAIVTDSVGRPHDPVDIELVRDGKVIRQVQAKFSETSNAQGTDISAVSSIAMQKRDKYTGMQRLIRRQDDYAVDPETGETISLVDKARTLAEKRAESGGVYSEQYQDVADNLTDELIDDTSGGNGIKSGGTTLEEVKEAADNPQKYARQYEMRQYGREIAGTSIAMAASGAVISGVVSGVKNSFEVLQNRKKLDEAIKEVGVDVVKGGTRGGITGALSSLFRIGGQKAGIPILSDSSCATAMAAGIIDGGVAIYSYAKGEIDGNKLVEQLGDTTIKSVTTVYFTKAAACVFGKSMGPFVPIAIYSVANYIVASTRAIINNAKLNAAEYRRLAQLQDEMYEVIHDFRIQLNQYMSDYEASQRTVLQNFLTSFDASIMSENNCDEAIYSILQFANQTGIVLQHTDFNDFSEAMVSDKDFVLK